MVLRGEKPLTSRTLTAPESCKRRDEAFIEAYLYDWDPRRAAAADVVACEEPPYLSEQITMAKSPANCVRIKSVLAFRTPRRVLS